MWQHRMGHPPRVRGTAQNPAVSGTARLSGFGPDSWAFVFEEAYVQGSESGSQSRKRSQGRS